MKSNPNSSIQLKSKTRRWFSRNLFFSVLRIATASTLLVAAAAMAFNTKSTKQIGVATGQDAPGTQIPDVIKLVGPFRLDQDLRNLPYIPNEGEIEHQRSTADPNRRSEAPLETPPLLNSLIEGMLRPISAMPPPLLTFDGINQTQSGCSCGVPDTNGDVGPNHYVQSVNVRFAVYDKNGNTLLPPTTFNSLFSPLVDTPCSDHNGGDPFVFYDQMADRWVVSDFAFPSYPGNSFWECIAVSQTPDPVAGGWFLYALQTDPANPTFLGDYPKMALWNNPQPGGAYYLTVNLYSSPSSFQGVRAYALDRGSMLGGGPANAISFMIPISAMPSPITSLVPAGFRTGDPPPAGRDEFLLAVDGFETLQIQTQVHGWYFHADFQNPSNSTFGTGPDHLPNGEIAVAPFINATGHTVPEPGTSVRLDALGDKIMTPVVYQNRFGEESLWADYTILLNFPAGPTAIRWYQFNVTGGSFPATPAQQQDWTNGDDGLWRWLPSIAVDHNGNIAIGYSTSSADVFPSIRYAGRLATDPLNNLGQGEAIMTVGNGAQTSLNERWGDYSMTTVDPADGISFWHTNEYYPTTSISSWFTRIGKFQFPSPTPMPTATPTATAAASPTPTPTPVCPQPQGYWKNNPDAWPVSTLMLGSQTYTQTELLTILSTPVGTGSKADASLILADQVITAKLNIANGTDGTPVTSTIADADAVLSLYPGKLPYKVRTNSTNGQRMVNDAATLESYNKGNLTPGCGG